MLTLSFRQAVDYVNLVSLTSPSPVSAKPCIPGCSAVALEPSDFGGIVLGFGALCKPNRRSPGNYTYLINFFRNYTYLIPIFKIAVLLKTPLLDFSLPSRYTISMIRHNPNFYANAAH